MFDRGTKNLSVSFFQSHHNEHGASWSPYCTRCKYIDLHHMVLIPLKKKSACFYSNKLVLKCLDGRLDRENLLLIFNMGAA